MTLEINEKTILCRMPCDVHKLYLLLNIINAHGFPALIFTKLLRLVNLFMRTSPKGMASPFQGEIMRFRDPLYAPISGYVPDG